MSWWRRSAASSVSSAQRAAVLSHTGTRAVNQDASVEVETAGFTLRAVADGLGGHASGEVASRAAVERCASAFRARPSCDGEALEAFCLAAHRGVIDRAAGAPGDEMPLSTLVALVTNGSRACWAHVGDSRLYHFRAGALLTRTRDHAVPEMLHHAGDIREDEIRSHPDRHRLLQALGQETPLRVAVSGVVPIEAGDAFLLCTDGWWEHVRESDMEAMLRQAADPARWLASMVHIIEADPGPRDNYTAIAVMLG